MSYVVDLISGKLELAIRSELRRSSKCDSSGLIEVT